MFDNILISQGLILAYFIFFAIFNYLISKIFKLRKETSRKIYHIFASFSMVLLLYLFKSWLRALVSFMVFFLLVYTLVRLLGHIKYLQRFRIDSFIRGGDIVRQILYFTLSYSVLIVFFWGLLGDSNRHLILFGISTWGIGDALAAIMGKKYGKKTFKLKIVDRKKTYLGFISFLLGSLIGNIILFNIFYDYSLLVNIGFSLGLSLLGGLVELVSTRGRDTFTIPFSVSLLAYVLVNII